MRIYMRHETSDTWDMPAIDVLLLTALTIPTLLQSTSFFLAPSLTRQILTMEAECYHNTLRDFHLKGERPIRIQSRSRGRDLTVAGL